MITQTGIGKYAGEWSEMPKDGTILCPANAGHGQMRHTATERDAREGELTATRYTCGTCGANLTIFND